MVMNLSESTLGAGTLLKSRASPMLRMCEDMAELYCMNDLSKHASEE